MAFPATPINGQTYTTSDGRRYKYSLIRDSWEFDRSLTGLKDNLSATSPPSVVSDSNSGYKIGSIWIDILAKKAYTCVDANIGAAIWEAAGGSSTVVAAIAPISPTNGQLFYSTLLDKVYIWNGSSWVDIVAGGSPSPKQNITNIDPTIGDDVTAGYSPGSIWINSVSSTSFINISANAGTAVWHPMPSVASTNPTWKVVSSNYTAISGDHLFADTSLSPITITLPSTGVIGDMVAITDVSGSFATNNLTVGRNGKLIMGMLSDLVLSTNYNKLTLTFTGTDWRITS